MERSEIHVGNAKEDELLKAHAKVYKHLFGYAETLALRIAVELRIADIIHSHGQPISLSELASKIESPTVNVTYLARIMRKLVRMEIFTVDYNNQSSGKEEIIPLYGLTTTSKWLLHDQELSLAPTCLFMSGPSAINAWYEISHATMEGGIPFVKANGETLWEKASNNPEFGNMFNAGMAATIKPTLDAIVKGYEDGFRKMKGSLVDVGGGTGKLVTKIVEAYPHIKGINFDLPHTIANSPKLPGVTHVSGDMFKEVPSADNVILKWILHDWADEECIKILKKCQEAVSKKRGKVIIVDAVLHPDGHALFDDATVVFDLLMMALTDGGKERTEDDWRKLLKKAGFTHVNFFPLQTILSLTIIEALHL